MNLPGSYFQHLPANEQVLSLFILQAHANLCCVPSSGVESILNQMPCERRTRKHFYSSVTCGYLIELLRSPNEFHCEQKNTV